jgi:hypothetical protein
VQDASQQIDDLIRQVKNGSAFESLAAAEKLAAVSNARRRMDALGATIDTSFGQFNNQLTRMINEQLSYLIAFWSDNPESLQSAQLYLATLSKGIDDILASRQSAERTAG